MSRDPNDEEDNSPSVQISKYDLDTIWQWNAMVLERTPGVYLDVFASSVRAQPRALAIDGWDGCWTYAELDDLSTSLAHFLVSRGMKKGTVVPLCFEKSRWTPVAMMAVMKAGGASVAIDPSLPRERLVAIIDQVNAIFILSSSTILELSRRLTDKEVIVIDEAHLKQMPVSEVLNLPAVCSTDWIYVVFTSGSTGQPKGVAITHANICSALKHQKDILRIQKTSRVYDFASYMFDVAWCNLLHAMAAGACLCIPSQRQRLDDLVGSITAYKSDVVILTPSTLRGLDYSKLHSLRNLHLIGEPLYKSDVRSLNPESAVTNLYGPTECTTASTALQIDSATGMRCGIGKGAGLCTWVVNPTNHDELVPIGSVGELLLEGPLVGAGYLGDREKTDTVFVEDLPWLLSGSQHQAGRSGRLYKTGDLVRYSTGGTLDFVGRKDTQVKVRGHRVELGDIQHHVIASSLLEADTKVAAEVARPAQTDLEFVILFLQSSKYAGREIERELPSQVWNQLQRQEVASSEVNADTSRLLPMTESSDDLEFWAFEPKSLNTLRERSELSVEADQKTTSLLLNRANDAFGTEPVDILLAAVWDAFRHVFHNIRGLTIHNEGHGRDAPTEEIDLSRTVGWFTTMTPIYIGTGDLSSTDIVRRVKDARLLTASGRTSFASQYLRDSDDPGLPEKKPTLEVLFNYLGQFQQLENSGSLFEEAKLEVSDVGPAFPAAALFEITVSVDKGLAKYFFSWNHHIAYQNQVREWFQQVIPSLRDICNELTIIQPSRTLCDYEFLKLDYSALEKLQTCIIPMIESINSAAVEDILPCTPMVDGMLLSQARDFGSYRTSQIFEIKPVNGEILHLRNLIQSWQAVLARHEALRSVFIEGLDNRAAFNQVILGSFQGDVVSLTGSTVDEACTMLRQLYPSAYKHNTPPHRLTLCSVAATGSVVALLEMSHAITDGYSSTILRQHWTEAYNEENMTYKPFQACRAVASALMEEARAPKMAYWAAKLGGLGPCRFPRLCESTPSAHKGGSVQFDLETELQSKVYQFCNAKEITAASIFYAAWAVVLGSYTGENTVCFGYLSSGRDSQIPEVLESVGAYANMLICRADLSSSQTTDDLVLNVHGQVINDMKFQNVSLAKVQHELDLLPEQSLFNTIVSFQMEDSSSLQGGAARLQFEDIDGADPTEYDVSLGITYSSGQSSVCIEYRTLCLSQAQAARLATQLQATICNIVGDDSETFNDEDPRDERNRNSSIAKLQKISVEDLEAVWAWNATVPQVSEIPVNEKISAVAREHPDLLAVCSWDGNWSYLELDNLSTKAACQLVGSGLSPGDIVPLCFEKSRWAVMAMVSVLKAGGAFVLLDPSLPKSRIDAIIDQTGAKLALCSSKSSGCCDNSTAAVITFDSSYMTSIRGDFTLPKRLTIASSPMYLIFTSGTTGRPKGVIITHSAFASACEHQSSLLGYRQSMRVYDFASHMFDTTLETIFMTLISGGCLCVPSDNERKSDLRQSLLSSKAALVELTPSVARTIDRQKLVDLEVLVLGGEPVQASDLLGWPPRLRIINTYGPSECTPTSTVKLDCDVSDYTNIGTGAGAVTWLVNAKNSDTLVPIGAVGELLLEGPLVGAGYLNDPELTARSFIENPPWLLQGTRRNPGRQGRLYKTGDLVRYNEDGSIKFIGRKGKEVKIRGQRMELGEVEFYIRECLPNLQSVTAAIVAPKDDPTGSLLAVFVYPGPTPEQQLPQRPVTPHKSDDSSFTKHTIRARISCLPAEVEDSLASRLPAYMIPRVFVQLAETPLMESGKTNHRQLRQMVSCYTVQELAQMRTASQAEKRPPITESEQVLHKIWSEALGIDDSFFGLGGDSITAMQIAASSRAAGLDVRIGDILQKKTIRRIATTLVLSQAAHTAGSHPGRLSTANDIALLRERLETVYGLHGFGDVEDAYPCTPMQERILDIQRRDPGVYVTGFGLEISALGGGVVDLLHIERAWTAVVERHPLLRTIFISNWDEKKHELQVVLSTAAPPMARYSGPSARSAEQERRAGQRAANFDKHSVQHRLAVYQAKSSRAYLHFEMHHAIIDGHSMEVLLRDFQVAYNKGDLTKGPGYCEFVKYVGQQSQAESDAHWERYLSGVQPCLVGPSAAAGRLMGTYSVSASGLDAGKINRFCTQWETTQANLVQIAWAMVLARYTGREGACFGIINYGRDIAIPGVNDIVGPIMSLVPCRIELGGERSVLDVVRQAQTGFLSSLRHQARATESMRLLNMDWPNKIFDTAISVVRDDWCLEGAVNGHAMRIVEEFDPVEYHIYVRATYGADTLSIELECWNEAIPASAGQELAPAIGEAIALLCSQCPAEMRSVDLLQSMSPLLSQRNLNV